MVVKGGSGCVALGVTSEAVAAEVLLREVLLRAIGVILMAHWPGDLLCYLVVELPVVGSCGD